MNSHSNPSLPSTSTDAASHAAAGRPRSLRERLFSFPAVLAVSLAYLVFILARRNIADPDLWWHLRNAQWLLSTGHLPVVDHYSYTAAGAAVLPFEWLSELAYYGAFRCAGLGGVFVLVFALTSAILLGVFRLCCRAGGEVKNAFLVSVGGAMLAASSSGSRTLLFGWLYLVLLLLLLDAVRRGAWKLLWLVPPLFCLWVNSHGSWPMGMVLFAVFIASGVVEGRWGHAYAEGWSRPLLVRLLATAAASAAAVFLNPFGERMVLYPFQVLFAHSSGGSGGAEAGLGQIQEFMSVDFHTPWGKVAMALIAAMLLAAIFSRVPWRLDEIGATLVALYYGLTYIRFLFLAGILLPPVLAPRVRLLTPYEPETDRPRPNVVALGVLLLLFAVSVPRHGHYANPVQYPEGAVAYMKAHGLEGNLFHDWTWGGYLLWHQPQWKVFIDGRGDPYGARGVFRDYLDAKFGGNPQPVLDKYHVQFVLMPAESQMAKILKADSRWRLLYSDKVSALFERAPPPAKG